MKTVAALIASFCISGCGGYLMVESRSGDPAPPPPRAVPASHANCELICGQEALEIALAEAYAHGCTDLTVDELECEKRTCRVVLRGEVEHGRDARIKVKVDRKSGEILSYRCKVDDDD